MAEEMNKEQMSLMIHQLQLQVIQLTEDNSIRANFITKLITMFNELKSEWFTVPKFTRVFVAIKYVFRFIGLVSLALADEPSLITDSVNNI